MESAVHDALRSQARKDAELSLRSLAIQIAINIAISLIVLIFASWLRPRHSLVRPKAARGWRYWMQHVVTVSDDALIERIGFDAVLFLKFIRLLRNLLCFMTFLGVCILIPVNITATRFTGDWPPAPFDLGFLSISDVNYLRSDSSSSDRRWYWSVTIATYLFCFVIGLRLHQFSYDYLEIRTRFFRSPAYRLSSQTLFVSGLARSHAKTDETFHDWLVAHNVRSALDAQLARENPRMMRLTQRYEKAVHLLEDVLAEYLYEGQPASTRPTATVHGQSVDAIDYYSAQVADLRSKIERRSERPTLADYGWALFDCVDCAHEAARALATELKQTHSETRVRISPPIKDIIWSNLAVDKKLRTMRRWLGRGIFTSFMFAWLVPVAILSFASEADDFLRLFPDSHTAIQDHWMIIGVLQAYISPLIMVLFFFALPPLLRRLARFQGCFTRTTRDQKVLQMLFIFFLLNHVIFFTAFTSIIGLYGQLHQLVMDGVLSDEHISDITGHLARNISDTSNFWVNLICIKAFGVSLEFTQMLPLVLISLRKRLSRLSPRRLRTLASTPHFDYAQNYNIVLFFFTIAVTYSTTSPIVLPFALFYFVPVYFVYKYMLMYIYVTKTESGGRIYPALFEMMVVACILFQVVTITLLAMKGGYAQAGTLAPLPVISVVFWFLSRRRLARLGNLLHVTHPVFCVESAVKKKGKSNRDITPRLADQFRDPALNYVHMLPVIDDKVKHLLSQVYPDYEQQHVQEVTEFSYDDQGAVYPLNPHYNSQVSFRNHADGRSLTFLTVSEQHSIWGKTEGDDHPCCCCCCCSHATHGGRTSPNGSVRGSDQPQIHTNHNACPYDYVQPSAPPIQVITEKETAATVLTGRGSHTIADPVALEREMTPCPPQQSGAPPNATDHQYSPFTSSSSTQQHEPPPAYTDAITPYDPSRIRSHSAPHLPS
ncbi:hypothetical protein BCR43DRAFT_512673 [Syncephalastrum racemosum]|uniref:DUF221-domain-containing protein n=1 Tax=Syncephalastrum racemosum TaxID=13706 RepID=A0A1X2HIS0_SYNRA|nr:hypothetical protein BCR43DRAFT_512673 [Syncephalastrum racemosum]